MVKPQQILAIIVFLATAFAPLKDVFADETMTSASTHVAAPEIKPKSTAAYNEMIGTDGKFRPQYQRFHDTHSLLPVNPNVAATLSDRPLGDSIRIFPVPLILTKTETHAIDHGSEQIGQALRLFFADIFINANPSIYQSHIITEAQVRAILESSHEPGVVTPLKFEVMRDLWRGMNADDVKFVAGPDIIRNTNGDYVALEVNVNNIGGTGDVDMVYSVYKNALLTPDQKAKKPSKMFIRIAAERFVAPFNIDLASLSVLIEQASPDNEGDDSDVMTKDSEDSRIQNDLELRDPNKRKLKKDKANRYARVVDVFNLDLNAEARRLQGERRDLAIGTTAKPLQIINFNDPLLSFNSVGNLEIALKMFKERRLRFFTSPGTEFLSNKALMPFIDDIVRFYLNEEPMIEMQPTEWVKSTDLVKQTTRNTVIKPSNGSQGTGVAMEKLLKTGERAKLLQLLKQNEYMGRLTTDGKTMVPTYVRQEFVDQSYLPTALEQNSGVIFSQNYIVDIRNLTYIDGSHTYSHPRKWGRGTPKSPGSLTNVSKTGAEVIVITPDQLDELTCASLLRRN